MKSLTQLLLVGVAAATLGLVACAAPAIGHPAPDFTLTGLNGRTHRLADYNGRMVVLEWVNPECPFVRKHYDGSGNIPDIQKAAVEGGAVWLSINSGHPGSQGDFAPDEVAAWHQKTGSAPTAYLRDQEGRVGKLYDVRHTPTLFIVNPAGTLVYAGGIDDISSANPADVPRAHNYVKAAIADLKAGKPVARPVTRAYGCNVKYTN